MASLGWKELTADAILEINHSAGRPFGGPCKKNVSADRPFLIYVPRLQNTQELAHLFICWVTLAYIAVRRKVSAVW
jgi:hypothetical protein